MCHQNRTERHFFCGLHPSGRIGCIVVPICRGAQLNSRVGLLRISSLVILGGHLSELFQLPDRKDRNCAECNANISTLIFLYREWLIADRDSEHSADLEDRLVSVLHRPLGRWLGACSNASAQFCGWPELAQKETEDSLN